MESVQKALFAMAEEEYRTFQSRLIPTVDPTTVIGVRVPKLRAYAESLSKEQAASFMQALPHTYFDENNLHAFLIERIADYGDCVAAVERFLPYVDNWATCDGMRPKVFRKHKDRILQKAGEWVDSAHPFAVRYGLQVWMLYGLDDAFDPVYLDRAASIRTQEYYVRMMVAWLFATALTKRYDDALPYLQQRRLEPWIHNKAIQKACESYAIPRDRKAYIKTLKG